MEGEIKILKKGGKLMSRGGALKRGSWNPLTNYVINKFLGWW